MKQITFRKARPDEIDTVLLFLKEAALWLQKKKIKYWQDWISPPAHFIEWIKQGFEQNDFYMVEKEGHIIGCFRLQRQDPLFWGKQKNNAGYIHSFTISRNLVGQNIGRSALDLIEAHCRQDKKVFIRLDCGVDIKGLRKYYEDYGFNAVGEVTVLGERLILYEKRIA